MQSRCLFAVVCVFLLSAFAAPSVFGQLSPPAPQNTLQPPSPTDPTPLTIRLNLSALVEIVTSDTDTDQITVIGMSPEALGPIIDSKPNQVPVRTETRTRLALVNGKMVQQTYTVSVPFTAPGVPIESVAPSGSGRTIKLQDLQAWTIEGQLVSHEDLRELLTRPTLAFVLSQPWIAAAKLPPLQQRVLREDTLFIYLRPVRTVIAH